MRGRVRGLTSVLLIAFLGSGCDPSFEGAGSGTAPAGRFRKARQSDAELSPEQRQRIKELQAIGYVSGSIEAPHISGVVRHEADAAQSGLNFYTSGHAPEAVLMDMAGRVRHRWQRTFEETCPGRSTESHNAHFWRRAHLFENGDILAVFDGLGILKLDRDSNLLWATDITAHHDVHVADDGRIFVLTREAHIVPRVNEEIPVLEDFVSILSPDGVEFERVSLLEVFDASAPRHSWRAAHEAFWEREEERRIAVPEGRADLFHTNSLHILQAGESAHPAFAAGRWLVSMCHLDTIATVDPVSKRVIWSETGSLGLPHDPTVVSGGNVMVFDNNFEPGRSRVVILNPRTRQPVWEYGRRPEESFYSRTCGAAQLLTNGNILVTESDNGRAFEVSPRREIVWEFYNPHRAGPDGEYIATLFEMIRVDPAFADDWRD